MNILNLFKVSIRAVANNKMRSFLSMLGIIIGVAAVIIMMSIGQGSKESIRAELSTMGTNLINIRPGADMRGGVRQDPSSMQTLKMADYERIMREKKYVTNVSPEVTASGQAIYGNSNTNTTVYGESPEYLDIKQWTIEQGDCFTQEDIKKAAKVCVVGTTIVKELYGEGADVIGKTIRFKSIPMRIIGVLKSKGYNNWGMDQDNVIIAPYSTVMKRIAAQTWFSSIVCSAITEELSDAAIEELTQILRDNHKLKGDAADDFTIRSQAEMMETMSSTMDTVTIILVVAAAFSLLVAGIGIMNIMLVSVTERTKEIGLRMAVGATGPVISLQFLIESVLISVTGGLLGILVGCSASEFIVPMFNMPSSVPAWSIYVSFFVCVCIGVLFGYIPAQKAANMDPIEAIRHESTFRDSHPHRHLDCYHPFTADVHESWQRHVRQSVYADHNGTADIHGSVLYRLPMAHPKVFRNRTPHAVLCDQYLHSHRARHCPSPLDESVTRHAGTQPQGTAVDIDHCFCHTRHCQPRHCGSNCHPTPSRLAVADSRRGTKRG